jgi:hypothetical protein
MVDEERKQSLNSRIIKFRELLEWSIGQDTAVFNALPRHFPLRANF